jgi:hypothetical protein
MNNSHFWQWFAQHQANLADRAASFELMFRRLDQQPGPMTIVETGCTRQAGNWAGDGQSTVLFDTYVQNRCTHSRVFSVDIDPQAVAQCQRLVSAQTTVCCADSVGFLHQLGAQLQVQNRHIDLVYLDSYDVDFAYWFVSAAHHLKELTAIVPWITDQTLVVVDDSGLAPVVVQHSPEHMTVARHGGIGGKGRLVAEYAAAVGAHQEFCLYQVGWTSLGKKVFSKT